MKNFILKLFSVILILNLSCTNEVYELKVKKIESYNFTYKDKIFKVNYEIDEINKSYVPIEDESYRLLNRLNKDNESLITYVIDDKNYILFDNNKELSKFLDNKSLRFYRPPIEVDDPDGEEGEIGGGGSGAGNNAPNTPEVYSRLSLILYRDINWQTSFYWFVTPRECSSFSSDIGVTPEVRASNRLMRLKDFSNTNLWRIEQIGEDNGTCYSNEHVNNRPNDMITSVKIYNCIAQFYEDINYGGRSIVWDLRGTSRAISNFNYYHLNGFLSRSWNDKVSSIRLSD